MRLKKHLPDFINNVIEFKEIDNAHTIELNNIDTTLKQLENNQFIMYANDDGLSRYEKMFGIRADSDINVRRMNLLNLYNYITPYTIKWLINKLTILVGKDNFNISLDHNNYVLEIKFKDIGFRQMESIQQDLRKSIPCNLCLTTIHETNFTQDTFVNSTISTYQQVVLNDKVEREIENKINQGTYHTSYIVETINYEL